MSEPMVIPAVTLRTFEHRSLPVVLECAGHRRAELDRPAARAPVGYRSGVRGCLDGRLARRRPSPRRNRPDDAVEVVLRGADRGAREHPGVHSYARSLPIQKALHPDTLLAHEMNGEPIPVASAGRSG